MYGKSFSKMTFDQCHNIYNGMIYMLGHFNAYNGNMWWQEIVYGPMRHIDLIWPYFGLNHKCANISLTGGLRQFVYIEDIYKIICGESFGILTFDLEWPFERSDQVTLFIMSCISILGGHFTANSGNIWSLMPGTVCGLLQHHDV